MKNPLDGVEVRAVFETNDMVGYKISINPTGNDRLDIDQLIDAAVQYIGMMPGYSCEIYELKGNMFKRLLVFEKNR